MYSPRRCSEQPPVQSLATAVMPSFPGGSGDGLTSKIRLPRCPAARSVRAEPAAISIHRPSAAAVNHAGAAPTGGGGEGMASGPGGPPTGASGDEELDVTWPAPHPQ